MYKVLFFLCICLVGCSDVDVNKYFSFRKHNLLKVNLEGHIKKPGIYLVEYKMKLSKVINEAGGYLDNAEALEEIEIVENCDFFINSNRIDDKININTASTLELTKIKGIGYSIATKIINYRQSNGNFTKLTQLMNIKGIKEKFFKKIYEYFSL